MRLLPLDPGFAVTVDDRLPVLPPALEAEGAAVWAAAKARLGDHLFNGPVFALAHDPSGGQADAPPWRPDRLALRRLDYRLLLAGQAVPAVATALGAAPLGVTGVLLSPDGVVLGRRAETLAVEPGCWEAAPAGSLDRPDPRALLAAELAEELGLGPADTGPMVPVGVLYDPAARHYEMILRLTTPLGAAALQARHRTAGSDEYQALAVVPAAALAGFLATTRPLVRGLAALLSCAGLPTGPAEDARPTP